MSVVGHEDYSTGISKVILKPTKSYPEGENYFYCDTRDLDIIEIAVWCKQKNRINCHIDYELYNFSSSFHREIAYKYLGYYPICIDHINGCSFDNTGENLNVVTSTQNNRNRRGAGYYYFIARHAFRPQIKINQKTVFSKCVKTEDVACLSQYSFEQEFYTDYKYDFLLDRRDDLDIVALEYSGQITSEEATFRHVMRYAKDNAWYVYRYNLFDYFAEHAIKVPEFILDKEGFMRHPITNKLLCPYSG